MENLNLISLISTGINFAFSAFGTIIGNGMMWTLFFGVFSIFCVYQFLLKPLLASNSSDKAKKKNKKG